MTTERDWADGNGCYLSVALDWLRLRLEREARAPTQPAPAPSPAPPSLPESEESRVWSFFRSRHQSPSPAASASEPPLLLPPGSSSLDERIERAREEMKKAAEMSPPPALLMLRDRLGLSEFEESVLLLCIGAELDTRVAPLCGAAQGDAIGSHPTFALALALFDEPSWDALSPERPLRYWRLIEIHQPGAQPLTTSALRADERIVNYAKGLNYLDDRLAPLLSALSRADEDSSLPPSHVALANAIAARVRGASDEPPLIELLGTDELGKQLLAQYVAGELGRIAYRLPADSLPHGLAELESLARLWQREAALLPLALYVDAQESSSSGDVSAAVSRFVSRSTGLLFLADRDAAPMVGARDVERVEVPKPTPREQRDAWLRGLARVDEGAIPQPGETSARLAAQFDVGVITIDRIVAAARATPPEVPTPLADRVWAAAVAHSRPRLDTLAQRIEPKAEWKQLVVPEQEERALRALTAQVAQRTTVYEEWGFAERMNRGLGISALFVGESGTGKTMAAEVIANELELALYRIDLSAVVSKYIGETEKNLRRVFDAAEDGGAILFFDEADALFGKRSEVKDSHDRYANVEINYLLQRMEAYRGLAILATNMKGALDSAFMRRLRFVITFPFPTAVERRAIWRGVFPEKTRLGRLDVDRLARLPLSGGAIHNVALNAAFLAASAGTPVTMSLVLDAARSELRKLDLPANEAELRWAEPVEVVA